MPCMKKKRKKKQRRQSRKNDSDEEYVFQNLGKRLGRRESLLPDDEVLQELCAAVFMCNVILI